HFLEYASRMQQAGKLDQAFKALKEFAYLSDDNADIRMMLAEQLKAAARTDEAREQLAKLYAETQGDARRSRATLTQIKAIDPDYNPETDPKAKAPPKSQKSSDLVFLNLDEAEAPKAAPAKPAAAKPAPPPPSPSKPAPAPAATGPAAPVAPAPAPPPPTVAE